MRKILILVFLLMSLMLASNEPKLNDEIEIKDNQIISCIIIDISEFFLDFYDYKNHVNQLQLEEVASLYIHGLGTVIENKELTVSRTILRTFIQKRHEKMQSDIVEANRLKRTLRSRRKKKSYISFSHLFLSNDTDLHKDLFGTNIPFRVRTDFEYSHLNFGLGICSEMYQRKLLTCYFNAEIDYVRRNDIEINYDIQGWEPHPRNYDFQISSLIVPSLSIKFKFDLADRENEFFFHTNLGFNTAIADQKLVVVTSNSGQQNVDTHREKLRVIPGLFVSFGIGSSYKDYLITLSFQPKFSTFEQHQNDWYFMQGKIFTSNTKAMKLSILKKI